MSSNLRSIADSLAEGLQSVSWDIAATVVQRKNWANIDVEAMSVPHVFVVPGNADVTRIDRVTMQVDYTVTVFVGQHVTSDAEVDAMLDLADSVMLQVRAHSFGESVTWPDGVTSPQAVSIDLNPEDALSERNVWRAVITATYRVFEANTLPTPPAQE
jgi:hypothetical protein